MTSASDPHAFPGNTLSADRVDVWIVRLSAVSFESNVAGDWLSRDERTRAEGFVFEDDRRRYELGRGTLRRILASYLRCTPEEIRFGYGEHGKPRLIDLAQGNSLEFNVSGSGDIAAFAVTLGHPVGIDIELLRPEKDDSFVERFFAPAEWRTYSQLCPEEKSEAFYRAWTRKEAYLKATGAGLSRSLASFEVSLGPGEPTGLINDQVPAKEPGRWTFFDFEPAPNYVGSLVVAGDALSVSYRQVEL